MSWKTHPATCFWMTHELRIGYKEEERGQRAKEVGEGNKKRRKGRREWGGGRRRDVTDYMKPRCLKYLLLILKWKYLLISRLYPEVFMTEDLFLFYGIGKSA